MNPPSMQDALNSSAIRTGNVVREHEVLRIAANIHGKDAVASAEAARREILIWAENRSGGQLPSVAWEFDSFDYLSGGRNSVGVRIKSDASDIWAIRADDPDKNVPGRTWTTEVVVGVMAGQRARFSVRQLVSTKEDDLVIGPHSPGLVQQVAEKCGLSNGLYEIDASPQFIDSDADTDALIDALLDPDRALPIFVLTVPDSSRDRHRPLLDAQTLARAVVGIGQVIVLPAEFTWALTNRFGRNRSVFGGAARAYMPGFSETASLYDHRLVLAEALASVLDQHKAARWMRSLAASESIKKNRLGQYVLSFGAIRNASLRARQEQLKTEGAGESELLAAAQARIAALEKAAEDDAATLEYFDVEAKRAEERAETAEAQLRAHAYRIQQLQERFRREGEDLDAEITLPASWAEFSDWCDANLTSRLVLAPAARRGNKASAFGDLELAARCLVWLATFYRDGRMNGAEGDFRDFVIEEGVRNSPCGGDEFDLDWQGRRHTADWHIKSGGNTRDPQRCLRIYYFWEPETQQIVVADMPHHRRSGVT